jgi:hypothetical protein
MTVHQVGPVRIGINGDNKFAELVRKELRPEIEANNHSGDLDLVFQFSKKGIKKPGYKYNCGGNFSFNNTDIWVQESGYSYYTEGLFKDNTTKVFVEFRESPGLPGKVIEPFRRSRGASFEKYITRNKTRFASYTTLWPLIHFELLQYNSAFIHAGIVDIDGSGTVLAGTGGAGKTSITLELLEDQNADYLSEDFGVIDSSENSYYSPRFMTIYHSDYIYGQSDITSYIEEELSGLDKLHWLAQIRMGSNPRRKVSPLDILDEGSIKTESEIQRAIYLSRQNIPDISVEKISTKEFVDRSLWASFRELKRFYNLLSQSESVGDNDVDIPSINHLMDQTLSVYSTCFSEANTYHIKLPIGEGPEAVISDIKPL